MRLSATKADHHRRHRHHRHYHHHHLIIISATRFVAILQLLPLELDNLIIDRSISGHILSSSKYMARTHNNTNILTHTHTQHTHTQYTHTPNTSSQQTHTLTTGVNIAYLISKLQFISSKHDDVIVQSKNAFSVYLIIGKESA
jgi:hypothetical protein